MDQLPTALNFASRLSNELPGEKKGVTELQWNLRNSGALSTMVNEWKIPTPVEFERRLSGIISDSLTASQGQDDNVTKAPDYWIRIADASTKLFVLERIRIGSMDEKFLDPTERVWRFYFTAVGYAVEIDAGSGKKDLVFLLNKALVDCSEAVEPLMKQIFDERPLIKQRMQESPVIKKIIAESPLIKQI